jgi:glycosyltransferase involved in cell wall biosynthesis
MLTFAVAMATYNGDAYLRAQLESLRLQTRVPDEIVITDDNSSDDTWSIIEEFQVNSGIKVKIYKNDVNLGYGDNFMRAASLCSADLIGFCDQDDVWDLNKIERCASLLESSNLLMCHHDARIVNDDFEAGGSLGNEGLGRFPVRANTMRSLWSSPRGFTQVFRSSLLELSPFRQQSIDHHSGKSAPMAHDQWIYLLATSFGKTEFIDEKLASYRQHASNVVGVDASARRSHLINQAANGMLEFSRRRDAALARSEVLRAVAGSIKSHGDGLSAKQGLDIADLYDEIAQVYDRRSKIYGPGKAKALSAFSRNLLGGWYVGWRTPRLGLGPMIKDALFATLPTVRGG